ncbi:MAG: outer membrane protein [Rhodothalassiaceae bacterium]
MFRVVAACVAAVMLTAPTLAQEPDADLDPIKVVKPNGEVQTKYPGRGVYGAVQAGYVDGLDFDQLTLFDGSVLGATLGYDFGLIRIEADYAFRNITFPSDTIVRTFFGPVRLLGDVDMHTALANIALDLPLSKRINAYVLGGGGAAFIQDLGPAEEVFAFQGGGGVSYLASRSIAIDVGYRYLRTEELQIGEQLETHNALFALRFYF